MQRILVLCEFTSLNGGERSFLATVDELLAAQFELSVACPPFGPLVRVLQRKQIEHIAFPLREPNGSRRMRSVLRSSLAQIVHACRPNILHANSVSMSRLSGPVARELRLPSLGHLRDMVNLSAASIADLNEHTSLLAVSEATRQWFLARGVMESKILTCHNGVDLQAFRKRPPTGVLARQLGIPAGSTLAGTIGQIGLRKGLEFVFAAAQQVVRTLPNTHFIIAGCRFSEKAESLQYEQHLHALAAQDPLAGHIHFLGYRHDIPQLLNELTIVVHAAHQEPLGRVLLEAAASGKAIIATNVGGTPEIFPEAARAAILVPPSDPAAMSEAIIMLAESPERRQQMEEAARRRAVEAFDARSAARRIADHYHRVSEAPAPDGT